MKLLIIGASGYLGNTIYKKLKECTYNDIYGTCCKSSNHELLQINVLNRLDIKKLLSIKPNIIIWSIRIIAGEGTEYLSLRLLKS